MTSRFYFLPFLRVLSTKMPIRKFVLTPKVWADGSMEVKKCRIMITTVKTVISGGCRAVKADRCQGQMVSQGRQGHQGRAASQDGRCRTASQDRTASQGGRRRTASRGQTASQGGRHRTVVSQDRMARREDQRRLVRRNRMVRREDRRQRDSRGNQRRLAG